MAAQEHLELATFIKNVHSSLRNKSKEVGYHMAWNEHCRNETNLEKYAASMKKLATKYWDSNEKNSSKVISRINWVFTYVNQYFYGQELQKQRLKENEILDKLEIPCINFTETYNDKDKLKVLDVGSCYNPFKIYDCFDVLAIDIAPASEEVYKCDFMNVEVNSNNIFVNNVVTQLKKSSFHIIVFSLLLEYLPSPEQRLLCCEKAYNLLLNEGILIIITPDSKHVGANAKFMKSWRYVLSKIGFSRIKYEKFPYLHCMVFRKAVNKEVAVRWAKIHENKELFELLYIPQDFQEINDNQLTNEKLENNDKEDCNLLVELPFNSL